MATKRRLNPSSSKTSSFVLFSFSFSVELSLVGSFRRNNRDQINYERNEKKFIDCSKETQEEEDETCKEYCKLPQIRCILCFPILHSSRRRYRRIIHRSIPNHLRRKTFSFTEALKLDKVINKKKRRILEKVKEYVKSDSYMYRPLISPLKLGSSSLKGKLQITNLVTMEVSTSTTTTVREENNCSNLRSEIGEQTLHNGRINSPKRARVILRTGLSRETDLSPAFSFLPEDKMVKPDQRRVTIK